MSTSLKDFVPLVADDPPKEGRLVNAPEFDLTQVAKKLALTIPVFSAAILGGLKALGVEEATEPAYVVAALGVTASGLLALGFVAAADILGRAYAAVGKSSADPIPATSQEDDVAAQEARDAEDQDADAERKRLDRIAEEERKRLDRVADDERERMDRLAAEARSRAEEEQQRMDRVAIYERARKDREAEAERKRLDRIAEEERLRSAESP